MNLQKENKFKNIFMNMFTCSTAYSISCTSTIGYSWTGSTFDCTWS